MVKKKYVSKGQRSNVSKSNLKLRNGEKPSVNSLMTSYLKKLQVITKPQNKKEQELKIKYLAEKEKDYEVSKLLNKFNICGMTKAAATQAVLTKKVDLLIKKWSKILTIYLEEEKKKSNFRVVK